MREAVVGTVTAMSTAIGTWMTTVQVQRNKSGLTTWDATFSSLFVHPLPRAQTFPLSGSCEELLEAENVDPLAPGIMTTVWAFAIRIGVDLAFLITVILLINLKYRRLALLDATPSSSAGREYEQLAVGHAESETDPIMEVLPEEPANSSPTDALSALQITFLEQQAENLGLIQQQLYWECKNSKELQDKVEKSPASHLKQQAEIKFLRQNADIK